MIRLVCNCGRRLRARDEAALRHAVCPSCGCPVGLARTTGAAPRPKPLTLDDQPLPGSGFAVVPLWNEGLAGSKVLPRYQVVTSEDAKALPESGAGESKNTASSTQQAGAERRKRRRRGGPLQTDLKDTLLFPFRCWKSIPVLTLLLAASLGVGLMILVRSSLEPVSYRLLLALGPTFAALIGSCAFWLVVFASSVRGEDSIVVWHASTVREFFIHLLRCLACFCAGPLWILALAGVYWFHAGDLAIVDVVLLAGLLLAAALHWWLTLLAVSLDDSLRSITPNGIAAALRRLGVRTSLIATAAVTLALFLIGVPAGRAIVSVPHNAVSVGLLLICCVALQLFLAYLARSLGVAGFLAKRRHATANPPANAEA